NAIIADVAPYRISSEALFAINTFLDEFLYCLIDSARSLDLVRIKLAIGQVLPTSLGKNAVQEAELELKTYWESGNSDHTQERTIEINPFPLQKVFEQFRIKCQYFSTLGERASDDRGRNLVPDLYGAEGIHIAPSLAIYLTAVLEYVGEYTLILVAKISERQGSEVAKDREVYIALIEDAQIYPLF
ncbi:9213_t:CDS:1, partial [Dentiscutata erythropus]